MPVRPATADDLTGISSLLRGDRLMRHGWDVGAWPDVPGAPQRQELWIRRLVADPATLSLVATGASGDLEGVLLARPALGHLDPTGAPDRPTPPWVIEELIVASLLMWPSAGRALLTAGMASLARWGGSGFLVGCPPHDHAMSEMVADAGLHPAFRFRLRSIGGVNATMAPGVTLPNPVAPVRGMPHSLAISPAAGTAVWCAFGGAQALLTPRRWRQRGGTMVGVTDPVLSSGYVDVDLAVIELAERHLRTIGVATSVVVSAGHAVTSLDVALDQLGYGHCMDWFSTLPPAALMLTAATPPALAS